VVGRCCLNAMDAVVLGCYEKDVVVARECWDEVLAKVSAVDGGMYATPSVPRPRVYRLERLD
jgi:hypothetical protein